MVQTRPPCVPPDETLWQRYSPHHELPVSLTTSTAIHMVLALLVVFGVTVALNVISDPPHSPPPPNGPLVVGVGGGPGSAPGPNNPLPPDDRREAQEQPDRPAVPPSRPKIDFTPPKVDAVKPDGDFKEPTRPPASEDTKEATRRLEQIQKEAGRHVPAAPALSGGGGTGGAKTGIGVGNQPGAGGPKGKNLDVRMARAERWVLHFNTQNGWDYRKQLADLSAGMPEKTIVAVRRPDGRFLVFSDLKQEPPIGRVQDDLNETERIGWRDTKSESIASLARALGLSFVPEQIYVFFPEKLELKLVDLELAYRGKSEAQIKETQFQIIKRGGVYEPVVLSQR